MAARFPLFNEGDEVIILNPAWVSYEPYESLQSRVLTANGFSKCAAMTGWRLGYLVALKPYFDPIYRLCQHSISYVSSFVQRAGVTALDCTEEMEAMRFSFANAAQDMIDAGDRIKEALLALQDGLGGVHMSQTNCRVSPLRLRVRICGSP